MEERFWELREEVDRTFDKWVATQDKADYDNYNLYSGKSLVKAGDE